MSNPQWAVRLEQSKIDELNSLIAGAYSGNRQAFIEDVLRKVLSSKYPKIHRLVMGIIQFNKAQHSKSDRVFISYRLLYSLLNNSRQTAILNYLKNHSELIKAHHKSMGLSSTNKGWNSTHRLKYERSGDKSNNDLLKKAKVDQLMMDLEPYIRQCA